MIGRRDTEYMNKVIRRITLSVSSVSSRAQITHEMLGDVFTNYTAPQTTFRLFGVLPAAGALP